MALENVKCYTLRLNLDNEQHRRVYEFMENLNPDIYKSKNQCLIDRIDPLYDKKSGDVDGTIVLNFFVCSLYLYFELRFMFAIKHNGLFRPYSLTMNSLAALLPAVL